MARRARKAVITAAGRGTRQFPATRSVQKEMLCLVDRDGITRPTMQIIVEDCLSAGIEEVCIVVSPDGAGPFKNHFRGLNEDERKAYAGKDWALREADKLGRMQQCITYVEQPSPEGFGHAVFQARDFVGDEPFLLLLGDHIFTNPPGVSSCFAQLLDIGAREGGSVTAVRLDPESEVGVTGVVKGEPRNPALSSDAPGQTFDIDVLKEKPTIEEAQALKTPGVPEGYYLCHLGMHLFEPAIFECLQQLIDTNTRIKNEIQLTSAQDLLRQRAPYSAAILDGIRWDIGIPEGLVETQMALALAGPFADRLKHRFLLETPR